MVDACNNIVNSKNLSIKICQLMNKTAFSFSISIDMSKKERKKVHHKRRERKKEEKNGLNKKNLIYFIFINVVAKIKLNRDRIVIQCRTTGLSFHMLLVSDRV